MQNNRELRQIVLSILNTPGSNAAKYSMTDGIMNWDALNAQWGDLADHNYKTGKAYEWVCPDIQNWMEEINDTISEYSNSRFGEIYEAYRTNTPIEIGSDYWSLWCRDELLALDTLPRSLDRAEDELDVAGQMCDVFIELPIDQKMQAILFYLELNGSNN